MSANFAISALRSVDLVVPDLAAALDFYTHVWALEPVHHSGGSAWLRGTGADTQILALHAGDAPAMRSMTLRARDRDALDDVVARARAHGCHVETAIELDEPGAGRALLIRDMAGRTMRVVADDAARFADDPLADHPERLAHVNINSDDVARDQAFFTDVLGFQLTDRSKMMAFVRTNRDHHSIVIAEAPVNTLNHVAFNLPSWEGVMRASGRTIDAGLPMGWGVGRHGPGNNVFAYFVDPFGIVVEYTAEVLQVDEHYRVRGPDEWTWPPGRTDQWGIAPPKSEACKRAQLAIPFA
ncbi:VOC family protein [Sphingomonas nostoxanthinifaciens]|uniref:VOC family protein n=1 Tax=Sphingomonas nostoxanthinifaciens TaxID=2872652 RepID=UPI001CC1FEB1|nr:VOC family protein [Sphingomonas nostoxanthinifaciens]UAK22864.1 VOC family protein [Sphingomonas nostoxanthinifaciens]